MKKILLLLLIIAFFSCTNDAYDDNVKEGSNLVLIWNKAYDEDTLSKSVTGLEWVFSYLGANLPNPNNGITSQNNLIEVDLEELGFNIEAQQKMSQLHQILITTEEYQMTGTIDLGRYVTLLLGAPEHYYKITGVPYLLSEILDTYSLNSERGYVNNSGVSFEHRIIAFSEQNGLNQLFFCTEIDSVAEEILGYETVELLPNGQPRFGIFDKDGFRINSTNPKHSNAGKPAKCMWCHESGIQPLFNSQKNFEGFIPYLDLKETLLKYKNSHVNLQNSLVDGVDFQETQQHTLTELIYISFMEPSAERLSLEWGMPLAEVENLLSGLPTHINEEFFYLGDLYERSAVETFAPFSGLPVSSSVREASEIEVNYIN